MALAFSTVIDKQARVYDQAHGLKYALVDITIGATGDYSTTSGSEGLDISGNASKFGFKYILDVVNASVRDVSDSGNLFHVFHLYDHDTGKLRLFEENSGTNGGGFDEMDGADLEDGDIVRLSIFGI